MNHVMAFNLLVPTSARNKRKPEDTFQIASATRKEQRTHTPLLYTFFLINHAETYFIDSWRIHILVCKESISVARNWRSKLLPLSIKRLHVADNPARFPLYNICFDGSNKQVRETTRNWSKRDWDGIHTICISNPTKGRQCSLQCLCAVVGTVMGNNNRRARQEHDPITFRGLQCLSVNTLCARDVELVPYDSLREFAILTPEFDPGDLDVLLTKCTHLRVLELVSHKSKPVTLRSFPTLTHLRIVGGAWRISFDPLCAITHFTVMKLNFISLPPQLQHLKVKNQYEAGRTPTMTFENSLVFPPSLTKLTLEYLYGNLPFSNSLQHLKISKCHNHEFGKAYPNLKTLTINCMAFVDGSDITDFLPACLLEISISSPLRPVSVYGHLRCSNELQSVCVSGFMANLWPFLFEPATVFPNLTHVSLGDFCFMNAILPPLSFGTSMCMQAVLPPMLHELVLGDIKTKIRTNVNPMQHIDALLAGTTDLDHLWLVDMVTLNDKQHTCQRVAMLPISVRQIIIRQSVFQYKAPSMEDVRHCAKGANVAITFVE